MTSTQRAGRAVAVTATATLFVLALLLLTLAREPGDTVASSITPPTTLFPPTLRATSSTTTTATTATTATPPTVTSADATTTSSSPPGSVISPPAPSTGPCRVAPNDTGPLAAFIPASAGLGTMNESLIVKAGGHNKPPGWQAPPQERFDWTGDGSFTGRLSFDEARHEVTLSWGDGAITITDVPSAKIANPSTSTPAYTPAAVADVTGDGRLDLIITANDTAAVLTGAGKATPSRRAAFDELGHRDTEWVSPPKPLPVEPRKPEYIISLPVGGELTALPLWDINGDGVNDFGLYMPNSRSQGATLYYTGKPCLPI